MTLNLREKGDGWCCSVRGSRAEVGLRKDTWLANSNLLFRKVVLFIFRVSKELTSIEFCKNESAANKNTVVDWNKSRFDIKSKQSFFLLYSKTVNKLNYDPIGPNTTVEVDKSLFTLKKSPGALVITKMGV